LASDALAVKIIQRKDRFGAPPKPARGARALPGLITHRAQFQSQRI
jgi:hypothetical protein